MPLHLAVAAPSATLAPLTTRRRLLVFGLPVALALLGVVVWVLWLTNDAATLREAAGRVKIGMTLAEVDAIFGRSADKIHKNHPVHGGDKVDFTHTWRAWRASNGTIANVTFNGDEIVAGPSGIFEAPTTMRLVRHWLGL